nr:immunoglobulin light chain junction region [Macaca mulatta]MOY08039.1 immunoglobulin light chain junction region [Macaca mulatta]
DYHCMSWHNNAWVF